MRRIRLFLKLLAARILGTFLLDPLRIPGGQADKHHDAEH